MVTRSPQPAPERARADASGFTDEPGADGLHRTYCRLCEALCGLVATVKDGAIGQIAPDRDHPVSEGHLCIKAQGLAAITQDPDRITTPLRRTGAPGVFEPVSWDEALDDIAARLRPIMDKDPAGIAIYKGNPASFASLRGTYSSDFITALGGHKAFSALNMDTSAKNVALQIVLGSPAEFTFPDLEDCDFLILIGGNPMVSHMSLVSEPRALHKLAAIHERGGVVVVDPRRTETAERFEHLAVRPDSDAWLVGAMLNHIFEQGLEQAEVLAERTTGWEDLREAVRPFTPERAARQCGCPAEAIRALAERFAAARTAACYGRVGTNRGRHSTLANIFIEALNIVTGRLGQAGSWIIGITPTADPAARPPAIPYGRDRSRIGNLPLVLGHHHGGTMTDEILSPGAGQVRALFVDSGNPVLSYPGGARLAGALDQLGLLVSLDLYVTETSRHAHYILPATTFYEREDFTDYWVKNAPRPWLQYTPAVVAPRGEARNEFDVFNALLVRLGRAPLYAEMTDPASQLSPVMQVIDARLRQGVYRDRLGEHPIASLRRDHPSGLRPAQRQDAAATWDRVRHADGKAQLWHPVVAEEIAHLLDRETHDAGETLSLFGRRKLGSLNSWMHNVERLVRNQRPTLLIHPDDAGRRAISNGARVRVATARGSVEVEAEVTDAVLAGTVNYPHGWGHDAGWTLANQLPGANINALASDAPEDWDRPSGAVHVDGIEVTVSLA